MEENERSDRAYKVRENKMETIQKDNKQKWKAKK